MSSRGGDHEIVNLLALVLLIGLVIAGLDWWGLDTGIPRWLACHLGALTAQVLGLAPLGIVIGVVLTVLPPTRGWGIQLVIMAVLLSVGAGVLADYGLQGCGGPPGGRP